MIRVVSDAMTGEVVEMGHLRAPRAAHFDQFANI
jgi:hypothetical protein